MELIMVLRANTVAESLSVDWLSNVPCVSISKTATCVDDAKWRREEHGRVDHRVFGLQPTSINSKNKYYITIVHNYFLRALAKTEHLTSPLYRLACPPERPRSRSGCRLFLSLSLLSRRNRSEARPTLRASSQTPEDVRAEMIDEMIQNILHEPAYTVHTQSHCCP